VFQLESHLWLCPLGRWNNFEIFIGRQVGIANYLHVKKYFIFRNCSQVIACQSKGGGGGGGGEGEGGEKKGGRTGEWEGGRVGGEGRGS